MKKLRGCREARVRSRERGGPRKEGWEERGGLSLFPGSPPWLPQSRLPGWGYTYWTKLSIVSLRWALQVLFILNTLFFWLGNLMPHLSTPKTMSPWHGLGTTNLNSASASQTQPAQRDVSVCVWGGWGVGRLFNPGFRSQG